MKKKRTIYFYNNLIDTIKIIFDNKRICILQLILTLIFLIMFISITFYFSIKAIDSLQYVFNYLEQIEVSDPLSSPLGDDPLLIYKNIKSVKTALYFYGLSLIIISFIFGLVNWLLVKLMIDKKKILDFIKAYSIVFFSYMIPYMLLFYLNFKIAYENAIEGSYNPWLNAVSWIVLIILTYFYFISISLTINSKFKDIPKKTLIIGKKITSTFPIYFISIIYISIFLWLIVVFIERNLAVLNLMILLLVMSICYSRILFATAFSLKQRII